MTATTLQQANSDGLGRANQKGQEMNISCEREDSVVSEEDGSSDSDDDSFELERKRKEEEDRKAAYESALSVARVLLGREPADRVKYKASGGYHFVFVVEVPVDCEILPETFRDRDGEPPKQFVLKIRKKSNVDSLTPLQIRQEAGVRRYLEKECGDAVPQPKLYSWNDGSNGDDMYLAEELIRGMSLDFLYFRLPVEQQDKIIEQLAEILVEMADHSFPSIGALDPEDLKMTPHVELCRRVGREALVEAGAFDIGPYKSERDYVLAHYDKEAKFYIDGTSEYLDHWDEEFEERNGTKAEYGEWIARIRNHLSRTLTEVHHDDNGSPVPNRFIICHGDLVGRNIMVRPPRDDEDAKIVAILDWEFAAIYPVSEFWTNGCEEQTFFDLGREPEFDEATCPNDPSDPRWEEACARMSEVEDEYDRRLQQIRSIMRTSLEARGWNNWHLHHLCNGHMRPHQSLQFARTVMEPHIPWLRPGADCGIQLADFESETAEDEQETEDGAQQHSTEDPVVSGEQDVGSDGEDAEECEIFRTPTATGADWPKSEDQTSDEDEMPVVPGVSNGIGASQLFNEDNMNRVQEALGALQDGFKKLQDIFIKLRDDMRKGSGTERRRLQKLPRKSR